jgi:hypothetical protein
MSSNSRSLARTDIFTHDYWGSPIWSNLSHKSYRPLTVLSFRFNHSLHGLDPAGYHLVNALLHALATLLFYRFCRDTVFSAAQHGQRWFNLYMAFTAVRTVSIGGVAVCHPSDPH